MEFCGMFFSESLNPNRLNPNQFAEFCGLFAEIYGFLRIVLRNFAVFYGISRNFAESLNPNRLNPNRLTAEPRAPAKEHRIMEFAKKRGIMSRGQAEDGTLRPLRLRPPASRPALLVAPGHTHRHTDT